jgi:hypothetical protein
MISSGKPILSGEAQKMDLAVKAVASITRKDGQLYIVLRNFPSFESSFEEPVIAHNKVGSIQVSLRSYSTGPFHRKSEQLTNLSFTLPRQIAASGTTAAFHSGDHDRVFISAKAPKWSFDNFPKPCHTSIGLNGIVWTTAKCNPGQGIKKAPEGASFCITR